MPKPEARWLLTSAKTGEYMATDMSVPELDRRQGAHIPLGLLKTSTTQKIIRVTLLILMQDQLMAWITALIQQKVIVRPQKQLF